jgi:hypothetical protein
MPKVVRRPSNSRAGQLLWCPLHPGALWPSRVPQTIGLGASIEGDGNPLSFAKLRPARLVQARHIPVRMSPTRVRPSFDEGVASLEEAELLHLARISLGCAERASKTPLVSFALAWKFVSRPSKKNRQTGPITRVQASLQLKSETVVPPEVRNYWAMPVCAPVFIGNSEVFR